MSLTKQVTQKLDEYGIEIFNDYEVKNLSQHVFHTDSMIVFVDDSDDSISVTFKATTKPERSASLALILNQIGTGHLHIMEPFLYDDDNEMLSGLEAYKHLESKDKEKIYREIQRQQIYAELLENSECHEC